MQYISYIVFIFFSVLYIFSLASVFPTGDAGGLIVSSHLLGIAHPPGYPVFSQLGKLFTLLPVGSIGIKVALLPAFFSVLSLYIVYLIVKKLTKNELYPLIAVVSLGVSYSFFFQTTMVKFYPLNAFLVLLLIYLAMKLIENGFDRRYIFISAFLLGLTTGLHHTGLFMIIPLGLLGVFYFRSFIKSIPHSVIFFLAGFLVNLYLYIRSIKESFTAAHKAVDFTGFINMLLRRFYGASSSIDTVSATFYEPEAYINAVKNFLYMIDANFGYVTLIFFIAGFIYLWFVKERNKVSKTFILFFVSFFMYSVLLSKMTMSGSVRDISSMYVVGNQYFIPAYAIYSILFSVGLWYSVSLISKYRFKILPKIVPVFFIVLPLIFLPMRFYQTMQWNNWVPYYHGKDLLSILPPSSVISTYGDNNTFGLWYMKLVGRYRDDVCHITSHYYNSTEWRTEGCKPKILYRESHPEFFSGSIEKLIQKKKFYSNAALSDEHPFSRFIEHKPYNFIFVYMPKGKVLQEDENFFKKMSLQTEKFLTPEVCLNHTVDDPFSFEMCRFFSNSYLVIASAIKPENTESSLTVDASISYGRFLAPFKLDIEIGKENAKYIELYKLLREYNDYRKCYLLE